MQMNKQILKKLVAIGIYPYKTLTSCSASTYQASDNIIYNEVNDEYMQVNTDEVSQEELPIALEVKKIEEISSIKSMIKFFVILTIINIVFDFLWFIYLLGEGVSLIEVIASMF